MASQSASRKTDQDRGIRNVNPAQKRVSALPSRTNVGDRYKGMGWDKAANDEAVVEAANDAIIAEAVNEEVARLTYVADVEAQEEEEQMMMAQMQAKQQATKVALADKMEKAGGLATRMRLLSMSITNVGTAYLLFQLPLAVMSLAALFFHAKLLETKETTWYGKFLGFFVDFEKIIPFELIGMACWGVIMLLSLGIFVVYLFYFQKEGISLVSSGMTLFISACCLALNIFPGTNIFPFLLIWVIYMSLFAKHK